MKDEIFVVVNPCPRNYQTEVALIGRGRGAYLRMEREGKVVWLDGPQTLRKLARAILLTIPDEKRRREAQK